MLSRLGPVMRCACGCGGSGGCDEPTVMRCACGCGGSGSCQDVSVARQAAPGGRSTAAGPALGGAAAVVGQPGRGLDGGTQARMEHGFGRDFGGVRVHTDAAAAASARRLGARAYTVGDHIVFGAGEYAPQRREGQRLIAHELTHTVQQRDRRHLQRAGTVSRPGDPHEREAEATANAIMAGRPAGPASAAPTGMVQRSWYGDAWDFAGDVAGGAYDAGAWVAGGVYDAGAWAVDKLTGAARAAYDFAVGLARALGGAVSISRCGVTVSVPTFAVDRSFVLPFPLAAPTFWFPLAAGAWPIGDRALVYGALGLQVSARPLVSLQLGPAALNQAAIVIDWCDGTYGGALDFSVSVAASLGAELRAGIGGPVGLIATVPIGSSVVPVMLPPIVNAEAGLAGMVLATAATTYSQKLWLGYAGGRLGVTSGGQVDLGLKLATGVAGVGGLSALGVNLCSLYWPLWTNAWEAAGSFGWQFNLGLSSRGVDLGFSTPAGTTPDLQFADLPVHLNTNVFTEDCPLVDGLCRVLYGLGRMPSQNGGTWAGHEHPPLPGPLANVFPRSPRIASGSSCRGACGPDCNTCRHLGTKRECVDDGGRHHWVYYPRFEDCPTHGACREHDGCYDWCAETGGGDLCLRMCDLECACQHPAADCIGWIFGRGESGRMQFSDTPEQRTGCTGPCPHKEQDAAGATVLRLCLDPIELTDPLTLERTWQDGTEPIPIWSKVIPLGYLGFATINVTARGALEVLGRATIDPIRLDNLCFTVDPAGPTYTGTADLHVPVELFGQIGVTGAVGATLDWLCLFQIAELEGGLTATGTARNRTELVSRTVAVVCRGGEVDLAHRATLTNALRLGFDLDAFLRVNVFGARLWEDTWNLASASWARDWSWELDVPQRGLGAGAITPALTVGAVSVVELLRWLLSDQPDATSDIPAEAPEDEEPPAAGSATAAPVALALNKPSPHSGSAGSASTAAGHVAGSCGTSAGTFVCPSNKPPTMIRFLGDTWRGDRVRAAPVTCKPGNTTGSPPSSTIYQRVFDNCAEWSEPGRWKRAHLIHGATGRGNHLHGPGDTPRNLILADTSINGRMSNRIEIPARRAAYGAPAKTLYYDVDVVHWANTGYRKFFAKEIQMSWGLYDPAKKKRLGPPPGRSERITSKSHHPPPPCKPGFTL